MTQIASSETMVNVSFKQPSGSYSSLILECESIDSNNTSINICTNKVSQCLCDNLIAANYYKYRMITTKNGFENASTEYFSFLQTRKCFVFCFLKWFIFVEILLIFMLIFQNKRITKNKFNWNL